MTKAELQKQINKLQKQLNAMPEDEPKEWSLEIYDCVASTDYLFEVCEISNRANLKPHGLGVYKTEEYAEKVRACLVDLLHEAKRREDIQDSLSAHCIISVSATSGEKIIKQIEEGTYE